MRRGLAPFSTALLLLGASASAGAEQALDETTADSYLSVTRAVGAEGCPDAAALAAQVQRVRGERATHATGDYRVSFSRVGGVYRAAIEFAGTSGARVLRDRGTTCASLEQATALTLALLLDSDVREPAELDDSAGRATPPTPPAPAPVMSPPPRRLTLAISAGGLALSGVLNELSPGALAELGLGVGRFRASVGSAWIPAQTLALGVGSVDARLLSGLARMCLAPWRGTTLRFDVCTGVYAGLLKVEAQGFTRNERARKAWLAVPLELALSTTTSPLGVELAAGALFPLRRHDFAVDNVGLAFESWPVGAVFSLRALGSWLL